jgi:FimV-like protein
MQQAMLAIQDLNPGAFIDGNINRLKRGEVLRLPDMDQMRSRSAAEATRLVAAQNEAFSSPRPAVDATESASAPADMAIHCGSQVREVLSHRVAVDAFDIPDAARALKRLRSDHPRQCLAKSGVGREVAVRRPGIMSGESRQAVLDVSRVADLARFAVADDVDADFDLSRDDVVDSCGQRAGEGMAGVRVERVRGLPFTRARHWKRALGYLVLYPALLWRALRLPRHDVVITLTDPPLLLVLGRLMQWLRGSRHVHWAQDLYPELAESMGVIRARGVLAGVLRGMATRVLRRADHIVAVGRCMKQRLADRGLPSDQVSVIPNWAPEGIALGDQSGNAFRWKHGLGDRFVIMYSGNLGLAHRFEPILDAAALVQATLPKALFLFVGGGPRLDAVQGESARRALSNVKFLPPQSREDLGESLKAADVHLVCMREALLGLVVPSKAYGVLAAGRPCVFLGPAFCEAARVIREYDCGAVLPDTDGQGLADRLMHWHADPSQVKAMGRRALAVSAQFTLDQAVAGFGDLVARLAVPSHCPPKILREEALPSK